MTTFDDREKAYEAQLAHDEDMKFKAFVRRNKALGLWAAAKLGLSGLSVETYASSLINTHLSGNGDEAVFARLRADFSAAALQVSDHQIRREMAELLAIATREIVTS